MDKLAKIKARVDALYNPEDDEALPDDFNPMDAYGGNFDDAFRGGVRHGFYLFAKELHELLAEDA